MKRLLSILFLCTVLNSLYSQSVTPVQTSEFCPNIEYTFTVSIPKTFQSIIGNAGCFVTQPPLAPVGSTFTFKGKFGDANQKQWFRINYTDATFYDIEFKKIKSLFFSATSTANPPCNIIRPNQTQPLVFPRCQVANATISFPNIQWFTSFENPEICFGSVTDYEYQLPAGWSIGSITSTGSNWIAGGNSVTVTSDLSTGDGMDIRIRASNKTCSTALAANGPVSTVRISRPEPVLSITSTQNYICSGCSNFTINNVPSGASIQWSLSNTTDASINGCSTCSTVNVCRNTNTNTVVVLTATVTHCTFTYTISRNITLGTGTNSINFTQKDVTCEVGHYFFGAVTAVPSATNYAWYSKDESNPSNPFVLRQSENSSTADFPLSYSSGENYYTIRVVATNPCGSFQSIDEDGYVFAPACSGGGGLRIIISPNPTSSSMTVQVVDDPGKPSANQKKKFYELQLTDKFGTILRHEKYANGLNQVAINISDLRPDLYHLRVWDGKKWVTKSVLKK